MHHIQYDIYWTTKVNDVFITKYSFHPPIYKQASCVHSMVNRFPVTKYALSSTNYNEKLNKIKQIAVFDGIDKRKQTVRKKVFKKNQEPHYITRMK